MKCQTFIHQTEFGMTTPRHNLISRSNLVAAITAIGVTISLAFVPEPDGVIYGRVYHRFNQQLVPTQAGEISVMAQLNGTIIATATVAPGTNYYLLRIPMDDGAEPRLPNTAKPGDTVRVLLSNTVTAVVFDTGQMCPLPEERAPVVPLDVAVDANVAGIAPDSNGDGIPDYWVTYYGFNPGDPVANLDTDGDGFSTYAEFVAGTDPTDPASKFAVSVAVDQGPPARLNLTFGPVKTYRTYTVLVSDSPVGPWTEEQIIQPTSAEPQTVSLPIINTVPSRFFRISIR